MTGLLAARPGLSCGLLLAVILALALALHRATAGRGGRRTPTRDRGRFRVTMRRRGPG